jgi:RHS repeat-associated protein
MQYDATTQLYFDQARWYEPASGRFISRDPIGFSADEADLYRYVGNSPANFNDPNGLGAWGAAGGAIEGGSVGVATGALVGAGVGSVIPVVGTVVGGLAGAALGGLGGLIWGGINGSSSDDFLDGALLGITPGLASGVAGGVAGPVVIACWELTPAARTAAQQAWKALPKAEKDIIDKVLKGKLDRSAFDKLSYETRRTAIKWFWHNSRRNQSSMADAACALNKGRVDYLFWNNGGPPGGIGNFIVR